MGTDGRSRLGEGEGLFTRGGWRKEAEVMDMDTAVACGGRSGDGKNSTPDGLRWCCEVRKNLMRVKEDRA